MRKRIVLLILLVLTGCVDAYEPTCTPINFGVPDSVAIVQAVYCR